MYFLLKERISKKRTEREKARLQKDMDAMAREMEQLREEKKEDQRRNTQLEKEKHNMDRQMDELRMQLEQTRR